MFRKILCVLCVLSLMFGTAAFAESEPPTPPQGDIGGSPPDGQAPTDGQTPPEKPDGEAPADGQAPPNQPQDGPMGGMSATVEQGTAAVTIDSAAAVSAESYASNAADENALRVSNAAVMLDGISISKTGDSSNTDSANFYGMNAGLLATDGAEAVIVGATVDTNGSGANGVFSYGSGTQVTISDSTITTQGDNSGGVLVTGGGAMNVNACTIVTQGKSSAALRSDRGGGTMTVLGGSYTSNGTGSPAVYSTAAISIESATLTSTASEAVVVEGKNSVSLTDCDVVGNMQGTYGAESGENLQNVMLYQSMSGDADVGRSDFSMTGGSLTAMSGDQFYVTNTSCTIELTNVALTNADGNLLTVAGNDASRGWGQAGSNGGVCTFTASAQTMEGTISVDNISSLELALTNGTSYTGAINTDGQAGTVSVTLDESSTWMLTADSFITVLNGSMEQVVTNGYTLTIANA